MTNKFDTFTLWNSFNFTGQGGMITCKIPTTNFANYKNIFRWRKIKIRVICVIRG